MKAAFFIGHHKTGSTSLQAFLAANYHCLLSEGILYPATEAEGIVTNLSVALAGGDPGTIPKRMNVREPHNALAFRLINEAVDAPLPIWHPNLPSGFQMLHLIERQIAVLRPQHLVICSEVMSRFADKGHAKILPRMTNHFAAHDVTIVLNLRRPDLYLASWHRQALRFGRPLPALRDGALNRYKGTVHFHYETIVKRWRDAFPDARFVVRNYDDVNKAGGSVVDFFTQAELPFAVSDSAAEIRSNPSIPYAMVEILRRANAELGEDAQAVRQYLLGAMTRVETASNSEVEVFGAAQRDALLEAFAPIHAELNALLDVPMFFADIEEARRCNPVPELDAARAALDELKKDVIARPTPDVVRGFISGLSLGPD